MRPICVLLIAAASLGQASSDLDVPDKRVPPGAYKNAPAMVRAALEQRHCELPETQHWDRTQLNIVSGHFASAAQLDWAAICILPDGSTRALIFWGKGSPCPAEIHHGWALESRFPEGQAGSLYLLRQEPKQILEYRKFFGDANTNRVVHDGVEVGNEHASLIYYCDKGRWLELQGSD